MDFKLNEAGNAANKVGTGEWHDTATSREYLEWLAEGNTPQPAHTLAEYKLKRVRDVNAECETRIFAKWSLPKQVSAQAGFYGAAGKVDCDAWVAAHINAADAAQLAINAAISVDEVKAINAVWPV